MSSESYTSIHHPKRRKMDIATKTVIFEKYHKDKSSILSLANHWNVSPSTIKKIIREELINQRKALCEMEKLLSIWIEDQMQRNVPTSDYDTQIKATELYDYIKEFYPAILQPFIANDEWLVWYKERSGYSHIKEGHVDSLPEVRHFPETLKALIETEKYLPQQVFNLDRTLLFWKSMPEGTYNSEKAKEIISDRITLVLGCNASGDCKIKPFMIYKNGVPGVNNIILPVHYETNASSWLSARMFEEWFLKHFVSEAMSYCQRKGIPFKILLLLDTAHRYRKRLVGLHPNIRVVFLPKCSSHQIQPMEKGIKSIFKAYYLDYTFNMFSQAMQRIQPLTLQEVCGVYGIRVCIANIKKAWDAIPRSVLSVAWSSICPHLVDPNLLFKDNLLYMTLKKQIQNSAKKLGFDMNLMDVENVVQFAGSELSNKALHQLAKLIDKENSEVALNSNSNHAVIAANILTEPPIQPQTQGTHCDEDLTDNNTVRTDYIKIETQPSNQAAEKDEPEIHSFDNRLSEQSVTINLLSNEEETLENPLDIVDLKEEEYQNCPNVIVDKIELAFDYIAIAMEQFKSVDRDVERFESVRRGVKDMLSCYKDLCEKKQT